MRLDCTNEFCDLSTEVATLKHLAYATECLGQSLLVPTNVDLSKCIVASMGSKVILLTVPQFDTLHFLLTHITETARRADTRLELLEEVAVRHVEMPDREGGR